jgi:ribosomal protein S14
MKAHAWSSPSAPSGRRLRCRRCGRGEHLVTGDGPAVCRICLFAWGHYSVAIARGRVVREVGGIQLRHASHDVPTLGCPLCRAAQVAATPTFDSWLRGRGG